MAFFDIYDLKTGALQKLFLTRGPQKRRRFIDYVNEGVAQLINYRDYFTWPRNAQFVEKKFNVRVRDPKLVLVVGSWENADRQQVHEAARMFNGVTIIDYDTLVHFFLGTEPGVERA